LYRGYIHFVIKNLKQLCLEKIVSIYYKKWLDTLWYLYGKFSVKVTDTPSLVPLQELQDATQKGRIQEKDIAGASRMWDIGLGAFYMRGQAIQMGVPERNIFIEDESLHTKENAEYVLKILKEHQMKSIILVTSPFHQLRTYLTFAKTFQGEDIEIMNYYADTGEWHPATWFLTAEHRKLVQSEKERIAMYRKKGDLL